MAPASLDLFERSEWALAALAELVRALEIAQQFEYVACAAPTRIFFLFFSVHLMCTYGPLVFPGPETRPEIRKSLCMMITTGRVVEGRSA